MRGGLIYKDDSDYKLFLGLLRTRQDRYGFKLHSYCLMSNHFHIQLETGDISISKIMESLLKSYANNFNMKYHYNGHVFQGSYKGILIKDPIYFLETGRYIHLNPFKAGMVRNALDYKYSSYRSYVTNEHEEILYLDKTLACFRDSDPMEYAKFVEAKANHEKYEKNIMNGLGEDDNWLPW